MKTPKQCRNRCDAKRLASFIPATGPDRHRRLTHFAQWLPAAAAQRGWTVAETESRAVALRS
jgi:hypothetical protein